MEKETKIKFIRKLHGVEIWHVYENGRFSRTILVADINTTYEQLEYHKETLKRLQECLK